MKQAPGEESGKGLTALFVRRPVLAFVLNTLIVVAGLAALYGVEIRELPDVDRPVITINADFEGAAGETIDREVTAVIEGAVARVSGVKSISSTSSYARSRVTLEFNDGVNLDVAASDARDAVSRVQNQLPDDMDPPRIVKADANADAVMRLAVTSDTMSVEDMTILVEDEIVDVLAAVPGVADVQVYGDREKIFRVDVNQAKLASHGLTVVDIRNALASVAFDTPAGSLTTSNQNIIVRATAECHHAGGLREHRHRQAARSSAMSPPSRSAATRTRPRCAPTARPASASASCARRSPTRWTFPRACAPPSAKIQQNLPEGMRIRINSDDAIFIKGAIHEVEVALVLSRRRSCSPSSTCSCSTGGRRSYRRLAMPVALIGTIAGDLPGRLFDQHPDAARPCARDRPRRGRRHRGAREHRAPAQRGHGAARRRRARHAGSVLRGDRDDGDARRRVHPAVLPARPDRRAVPRIRLRARDVGAALRRSWPCRCARCSPRAC